MDLKEIFEGMLVFIRKEQSPVLHLRDFNIIVNEAQSDVIEDLFMAFEANGRVTDHLQPLKVSTTQTVVPSTVYTNANENASQFALPADFRHIAGVRVNYVAGTGAEDCYENGDNFSYGAKVLTSDNYGSTIADPFQRPRYFRPRYIMEGNLVHVLVGEGAGITISDVSFDYLKNPNPLVLTYNHAYGDATGAQSLQFNDITNRKIRDRVIQMVQTISGDPRTGIQAQASGIQPQADVIQNVQQ